MCWIMCGFLLVEMMMIVRLGCSVWMVVNLVRL